MRAISNSSLGGEVSGANGTPFSERLKSFPIFVPSEQVMVRLLPSTTVTGPTGSMVTV